VKGHRFHVRKKMKENNGKLNKLEAALIKRILRINWYLFLVQFWSSLIIISLSLSLGHT